jgi:tRNA (Thr-GGU) A37 N-methylase
LHQAARDILKTHPRNDQTKPLGLHRVTVREIAGTSVKVGPIEAIDGTPVVDIKPVLSTSADF